jgi:hypothetical protein
MSANVILESTQQETRNRRWAAVAAITVIGFFVNVIMFVVEMIDRQKLKLELRSYIPHSDDIFIVTYPRSGTTLVQMILYQLLTDGEMDFAHIQEWSPFYESRIQNGQSFEEFPSPRVFKSHLYYKLIPKGPCKYIYVVRNGKDVAVSAFHFSQSHMGAKLDFGTFFDLFLKGKYRFGSWFKHVGQWWENRHNLNVMFLTYEELTRDRERAIKKIIDFCGKKVEPEKFSRIMERSSFAFMKQHEDKFDSLLGRALDFNFKTGSFIRKAQAGQWKEYLSNEQEELFQRRFTERLNTLSAELKDNIR